MTTALIVFMAVLALVVGPYLLFVVRPEDEGQRKLRRRLRDAGQSRKIKASLVKETERLSSVNAVDRWLNYCRSFIAPLQRLIEQSGYRMTVGTFLFGTGTAALVPGFLVALITHNIMVALIVGACTGILPYVWLRRARGRRLWKFEELFPEGIDLIARALRAGHTFQTGLSMVGEELSDPVGAEFRLLYDQQNFGMGLPEALRSFAERVPLLDAKFFATAVLTQRDAGGNLAEVLDNLSSVIRERFKVKRQVRVISAHGRITGWVLAGLPPVLSLVFLLVSPKHMQTLFHDPIGVQMLIGAVVLQVLGTLAIRKIVNIEY